MQNQPKMYPQRGTALFADGRSVRPQVPGTVARSQGKDADYLTTGILEGQVGNAMPFPVTVDVLARGQERFNIYCSPCHSRVGNGKGMIVERGYYNAASFHSERLRQAPLGYFFKVMTEGYGAMPSYHSEVTVQDRWAIVAYIRALQLSQNARTADVPTGSAPSRLVDVVAHEGFPPSFLLPWGLRLDSRSDGSQREMPSAPVAAKSDLAVDPAGSLPLVPAAKTSPVAGIVPAAKIPMVAGDGSAPAKAVPAPTKALSAPAAPKADAVAGKAIYAANCSVCHQPTRAGLPPVFPSLVGIVERVGAQHIRETVQQGKPEAKPPMPAFTALSATNIDDLIEFLRTAK